MQLGLGVKLAVLNNNVFENFYGNSNNGGILSIKDARVEDSNSIYRNNKANIAGAIKVND